MKAAVPVLAVFVGYYLSARLGLEIATINEQASPVWPATGIAMGFALIFGPRVCIGIFWGAFLSNYQTGLSLFATVGVAVGNTLETLFFIWAFNKFLPQDGAFSVHRRSLLGVFLVLIACSISATFGSLSLVNSSVINWEIVPQNWLTWWVGDLLGALFLAPIIYNLNLYKISLLNFEIRQFLKFIVLSALTILISYFVFSTPSGRPYLFLIFLSILFAGSFFPALIVYLTSLAIGSFAVWQTINGHGPFVGGTINENLIHLQVFLFGLSVTCIGINGLKIEGFFFHSKIAFIFGWFLSGSIFAFSYKSMLASEEALFRSKVHQATKALENRMTDYTQMLGSGVSFFNASDFVSKSDWQVYSKKLLSTNYYPGIQGLGVIFSSTIRTRFASVNRSLLRYQPVANPKKINTSDDSPPIADSFVITYLEPEATNLPALNLDISSEKVRYQAAMESRDTGRSTMTDEIHLVQDRSSRSGFLLFSPIYYGEKANDSVEERRDKFLGFVYAPIVFEKFIDSAQSSFSGELELRIQNSMVGGKDIYVSTNWNSNSMVPLKSNLVLSGKTFVALWKRGPGLVPSISMISSWIGFFGTVLSLFLAIMLSTLQVLTSEAQKLARNMTIEVEERRRAWQALTESSPVGIFLTDSEGSCTYVNPAWTRMAGLSPNSALGSGWSSAVHPEDIKDVSRKWNEFVGGGSFNCEYRFVHADGTVVWVSGQAKSLTDTKGNVTGYFGTVQDMTQLRQNQMALITASRMSSIGEMASGIAHEINNPLAIIRNKIQVMSTMIDGEVPYESEKMSRYSTQVSATVFRIAKIIRGLQSFARETVGDPDVPFKLSVAIEDALDLCRERFQMNGTQLSCPSEAEMKILVFGRSEQISQVVLNLLTNSFDAIRNQENSWVKISITQTNLKVSIIVSDSGPGIPYSIQSKVFDPFFTTKAVGQGTGLGLSISRGIVERHKGRLSIDQARMNTTFVIELPLLHNLQDGVNS